MFTSIRRSLLALAVALLSLCGTGCTDIARNNITFSDAARQEGLKLMAQKDYSHAAGAFQNAVRQEPRDYRSHYYLGLCYDETHRSQLAIQSYKTALGTCDERRDEEGFRPRILDAMARSIAANDDRDTELNALEARIRANPAVDDLWLAAKIYRYRKDPDLAMKYYEQALMFQPRHFAINKEYGLYLLDGLAQHRQAELVLRRAYGLKSDDVEVNGALQRLGVVVGPSLKDKEDLAKPAVPTGPIPDLTRGL